MRIKIMGTALFLAASLSFFPIISNAYAQETAKAKEGEEAAPKSEFDYVHLSPLYFPVINKNGASQMVSIVVSLEVTNDEDALEKINYLKPKITDAYIQAMYGRFSQGRGFMGDGSTIDVSSLKSKLTDATYKVVTDPGVVHDVLLQIVQQRRI